MSTPIAQAATTKRADSANAAIDRTRLAELMRREELRFVAQRPKSKVLFERAQSSMLSGVPMHWMTRWAGGFPVFVAEASGRRAPWFVLPLPLAKAFAPVAEFKRSVDAMVQGFVSKDWARTHHRLWFHQKTGE